MKITIAGAGTTGSHLAKYLSGEKMDIFIIDHDFSRLELLDNEHNLMTIHGDATSFETLRQANAGSCDFFLALTDVSERNIVACSMAKSMGAHMTIARVDRLDYLDRSNVEVVRRMGVDEVVFPEYLIAQSIVDALKHGWAQNWYEFNEGAMILLGVRLSASAPLAGKCLRDTTTANRNWHVAAIRRDHTTLIPGGNHELEEDDILYISTSRDGLNDVLRLTGKVITEINNVIIAGGGLTSQLIVNNAPQQMRFTIIESDRDMCNRLIQECQGVDVICGEPTEQEVFIESGVSRADAIVALTGKAAENILTCMLAKEMGVRKTIAEVGRQQLVNMAESFHIGSIVNKQMLMANAVFQFMIDSGQASTKCLALPDAELARLVIKEGSRLTQRAVRDMRIPEEITFAGIIRDGRGMLVTGSTRLQTGDEVLVMCLQGALRKANQLFS